MQHRSPVNVGKVLFQFGSDYFGAEHNRHEMHTVDLARLSDGSCSKDHCWTLNPLALYFSHSCEIDYLIQ